MWRILKWLVTGYWTTVPVKRCPDCKSMIQWTVSSPLCWDERCRKHCEMGCECERKDRRLSEVR